MQLTSSARVGHLQPLARHFLDVWLASSTPSAWPGLRRGHRAGEVCSTMNERPVRGSCSAETDCLLNVSCGPCAPSLHAPGVTLQTSLSAHC